MVDTWTTRLEVLFYVSSYATQFVPYIHYNMCEHQICSFGMKIMYLNF